MVLQGSEEKVIHYEWNEEYQDFTNRFEQWIEIRDLKINTNQDLYDALSDWLGITKRGKQLPTQTQMDFFTEYYGAESYDISAYEREQEELRGGDIVYEYKSGSMYNITRNDFSKHTQIKDSAGYIHHEYVHYKVIERTYNLRYGARILLVDKKTGRILAHHRNLKDERYLGSQI